jgi:hypothetical protein
MEADIFLPVILKFFFSRETFSPQVLTIDLLFPRFLSVSCHQVEIARERIVNCISDETIDLRAGNWKNGSEEKVFLPLGGDEPGNFRLVIKSSVMRKRVIDDRAQFSFIKRLVDHHREVAVLAVVDPFDGRLI